jgi:hypothetical protein
VRFYGARARQGSGRRAPLQLREAREHHTHGGLLLRRDIHRLFDDGSLAVNPSTLEVDVSTQLEPFPQYAVLHDRRLTVNLESDHELAAILTNGQGVEGSWLERFGLEVVSVAVTAIEYDRPSRELMDKYNKGTLLGGAVGNAYAQTTVADAAMAAGENGAGGDGLFGLAVGLSAMGGVMSGMTQPTGGPTSPTDPVAALSQLKAMVDQGLITAEQYSAKQREILSRR